MQYTAGEYEEAVLAYLRGAEMGLEVAQSNGAWMLARAYGAGGPAATRLAQLLHQRAAGQVGGAGWLGFQRCIDPEDCWPLTGIESSTEGA